ncbi:MAG: IS91 family transposase [Desulfobacteraceae bacterium]
MPRPSLEVAQIFRHHGPEYRKNHGLSPQQHQAMRDIERCQTSSLGGHVDYCEHGCGYFSISYNSCRNRHCPKCQSFKQAKWLEERRERLLPTQYFHLVVTLPHELDPLALYNQELIFNLFFAAAPRALLQLARDYDRLRAQVGFTPVLHTWDQNLKFHPHLHIVVTGGGLSADATTWIVASNSFPLPVKAISKIIRAKFLEALDQVFQEGRLQGKVSCLTSPAHFRRFIRKLKRQKWVVYSKELFNGSHKAYQYLRRHTHRVAISNHRLVSLADGIVTFRARDNSRPGQQRLVTTTAQEFIRLFLLHILPPRFVKIRHFGLMAPANAKTKLEIARYLIGPPEPVSHDELKDQNTGAPQEAQTWQEMMRALTGVDFTICPQCGQGRLIRGQLTSGQTAPAPAIWDSS